MTYAENVVSVYRRASDAEHAEGMTWYNEAYNLAVSLSPGDPWRGAGVIACYSPLTPWWRNVELATDSLTSGVARRDFLPVMSAQAQRILDGEHPLDVLGGDKVRAFASAIATNGASDVATIDRHAHDIAMGRVFTDAERKIGKRLFRVMSAHYREAAAEVGIRTAQIQAITWVVWRREKGIV